MRLLITTQAVDLDDPVLGFFHRWILEFAKHCETVEVICLREGRTELPANVRVHSLGKESGASRLKYTMRFYRLIFSLRSEYDAVFVHMNPEYVVLGGLVWRAIGKRVALWYNHAARTLRLRIAVRLANVILTTSPFSASVTPGKTHLMPAGIDTKVFRPLPLPRDPLSIYYQGRIAPSKRVAVLCEALRHLHADGILASLTLVGPEETAYGKKLREEYADLVEGRVIVFLGPKKNAETPELFARHAVSVNLASRSGLDKSVLESCACGTPAIASSEAFCELVPPELHFKEGDSDSLAFTLRNFFAIPAEAQAMLAERLRALVVARHSVHELAPAILSQLTPA